MSLPQRPPYRVRRRTIRTLKITADSHKLGMIRGQSEPLHSQRPSLRAAGQKVMLKASAAAAPIVHKRSALDLPYTDAQVTAAEVRIRPKPPVKHPQMSTSVLRSGPEFPSDSRSLTKFEAAVMELEAKSLLELSNELFPDDPLALELPEEAYKASLPARLVYEVPSQPLPALDYSSIPHKSSRAAKSQRTPRRDLPNLLDFDPSSLLQINAKAVSDARSSVLVRTADAMVKPRLTSPTPPAKKRGPPTAFELALGLKQLETQHNPL